MSPARALSGRRRWALVVALGALAGCELVGADEVAAPRVVAVGSGGGGGEVTFSGVVQPILLEFCSGCHNASSATGGVDVTSFDGLQAKAGLVVPGDPDASLLLMMLEDGMMPPAGKPRPTTEQVAAIRAWVVAGAMDD